MAQLYFYYSAMNAGKTTSLLQSSYNYKERGMHTVLYTFEIESLKSHFINKIIRSRIGLTSSARIFNKTTNFFYQITEINHNSIVHCVLIDECHFLNRDQVVDLSKIVDILNIPVLCYGLRTDFRGDLFAGSAWLLAWADKLIELKTICYCGRKANRVLRLDKKGAVTSDGDQILLGGNDRYVSVCRKHFIDKIKLPS
ncbi:thymidine kinase [Candidatus Blochmannia ocreatus (nom. nud.)]|uniref:Thymidine kinase n=1 Tax=Candidatus Blochmannia ocreatus (nom. nud.) TaxID=251538 RepID=A0ABY4SSH8_9ENTR|nr:thymidine kinase [Candidatus Blochmannia ocreatus]URJ24932.1 thymidine kinase [Candidatus Blochmannia ocreatus]